MKVAVVAHSGKVLGGGLSELRAVLGEYGVREPMWAEVDKSRKAPKRVSAALKDGAGLVIVWGGDGMVQQCVSELAGSGVRPGAAVAERIKRADRGDGGGRTEQDALRAALRDKLPDAEIKARQARVRDVQKQNEARLAKAQDELRAVLTVRQEAGAVMAGLLPP